VELHPSVCSLEKLELLSLTNNRLKTLPSEIGSLRNLEFLNLVGNPIKEIPTEISYLDKSNGGKLHRLAVKEEEIGTENYLKLKKLLPQTNFD
jgi:Leucine-rich repeat (LRR) protein